MHKMKILIINPFGIGDVIFSTPLVQTIRESFPDSFIGYVCNKRAHEVLRLNPNLDIVYVYEKDEYREAWRRSKLRCLVMLSGLLRNIRRERFDVLIDLSLGYQYGLVSKIIGIRKRFGFNYRNRGKFLTKKIGIEGFHDKHVIEYYNEMLNLLGIGPAKCQRAPKVYCTGQDMAWARDFLKSNGVNDSDLIVGVIPGCGASWGADAVSRRWDREKFADVCDSVIDRYGAKVVLLGDRKETDICTDMGRLMKHKPVMACGKTTLSNLLGIISRCNLIITNDGGPLHIAVGLGVRTVSIFGPVDEKVYGPYPAGSDHVVVSKAGRACRPCYRKFKLNMCEERSCLKDIGVEEVLKAVDRLLSKKCLVTR